MTSRELSTILNEMYHNAPAGKKAVMVHLFGIKYPKEIQQCGVSKTELAIEAGISSNYGVEINKGVNLSEYVELKGI